MVGLVVSLLVLLCCPAAATAATRYAAPEGSRTSATCAAADPCALDRAVNLAAAGDEVVVGAGEYRVITPLRPTGAIDLHGDRDRAAPDVVGDPHLSSTLLTMRGGTLGHLSLSAIAAKQQALSLSAGAADGVHASSVAGPGAEISATKAGTTLRNSVVVGSTTGLAMKGKGAATVRNVTAIATGQFSLGIDCDVDGTGTLVNVLVRGGSTDLRGHHGDCTATYSNFRADRVTGMRAGIGNQSAQPLFADADYRPAPGSPTIDAGTTGDGLDPDGRPRTLGRAPDIGAYEFAPAATVDDGGTEPPAAGEMPENLRGVPLPKQGVSVVVAPARGRILVRRPGSKRFRRLDDAGRVPVGSVVDARAGRVRLVSAIGAGGAVQSGLFWGSKFKTGQRRKGNGMTTLTLRGGNLAACRRGSAHTQAVAAASKKRKKHRRRLWARDRNGRFRTHGNDSVATARGTAWLTEDRCEGTFTRVSEGAVSVRDLRRHRSVLVEAGHSYLARHRR
jgi:hypothetical protein